MKILDKHLETAARLTFEGEWDEARVVKIEAYLTIYSLIGLSADEAREKAEELAEEGGLRGLRMLF